MLGFKNIHYNKSMNKLVLWEIADDGKTHKSVIKPTIDYYIEDKSGNSETKDIWGTSVKKQVSRSVFAMNRSIELGNLQTCEAGINQELKYLQKKFGGITLVPNVDHYQICTVDIELAVAQEPQPFDVMVESCETPINLISVYLSKDDKMYTFGSQEYTGNSDTVGTYYYIPDEKMLLEKFIKFFRRKHIDILTGWNCKLFDMRYMIDRAEKLGIEAKFSPLNVYETAYETDKYDNKVKYYKIPGLSVLDGKELYSNFTYKEEVSLSLNYIGQKIAGEGKISLDDSINTAYLTNWNQFVEYNIQDVNVVKKINDKLKFIELTIDLCHQALIPLEGIFSSIQVITGYMLRYLHKFGLVMPDISGGVKERYPGGFVKATRGVYRYVTSFDFESLYPKIMMMFNISPETLVENPTPEMIEEMDLIKTPSSKLYTCMMKETEFSVSGIYYRKDKKGIIPQIVETIFNERKHLKNKMKIAKGIEKNVSIDDIAINNRMSVDDVTELYKEVKEEGFSSEYYNSQQQIRKIIINSMYGVLGNRYFSFYNIKNAMAITIAGQDVIQYVSDAINKYFQTRWHHTFWKIFPEYKHLKGKVKPIKGDMVPVIDTDSSYICFDELITNLGITFDTDEEFRLWVGEFDKRFITPFFTKILDMYAKKYNTANLHNFKREKIITRKLVLKKKKYADIVIENEGDIYAEPKLSITGIDIVKTSTASYFKSALTDVLKSMLVENDIELIGDKLRYYREEFKNKEISDIASPRSVNNYYKYAEPVDFYINHGDILLKPHCPQHVKSSMYYNYLIRKKKLMYPFISNGSKVRVVYVNPNNILRTEIIAFVGEFPVEFSDYFEVDYKKQFHKGFLKLIGEFYDAFGWGKVMIEKNNINDFIEF